MIVSKTTWIWMTNRLEQLFAVVITAGLVLGNFLLFTPWRNGKDPRQNHPRQPSYDLNSNRDKAPTGSAWLEKMESHVIASCSKTSSVLHG